MIHNNIIIFQFDTVKSESIKYICNIIKNKIIIVQSSKKYYYYDYNIYHTILYILYCTHIGFMHYVRVSQTHTFKMLIIVF